VSHRIDEGPWRSSGQPIPFITFLKVLKNNIWRSNKRNEEKRTNAEHGEENVQVKSLSYVHRWWIEFK